MPGVEEGAAIFKRACVSAEFRAFAVTIGSVMLPSALAAIEA